MKKKKKKPARVHTDLQMRLRTQYTTRSEGKTRVKARPTKASSHARTLTYGCHFWGSLLPPIIACDWAGGRIIGDWLVSVLVERAGSNKGRAGNPCHPQYLP